MSVMKWYLKFNVAVFFVFVFIGAYQAANAEKPEKVTLCHYGEEIVLDENGDPLLDENGDVVTEEVTVIIRISENAVDKHIENHGDFVIEDGAGLELCADDMQEEIPDEETEQALAVMLASPAAQPVNIADTIHPDIHQNNGTNAGACPQDDKDHCNNRHGIANVPGQSDNEPGVANLANVHGGIGAVNKNVE